MLQNIIRHLLQVLQIRFGKKKICKDEVAVPSNRFDFNAEWNKFGFNRKK